MSQPTTPTRQPHQHGPNCGHTAIRHDGHVDYLTMPFPVCFPYHHFYSRTSDLFQSGGASFCRRVLQTMHTHALESLPTISLF